ncbi:MAG: hypothetical protein J0H88_06735 [Sphingomonadales bacterium]|nr:hypothetical protein [Sphingomonadales bacterium]
MIGIGAGDRFFGEGHVDAAVGAGKRYAEKPELREVRPKGAVDRRAALGCMTGRVARAEQAAQYVADLFLIGREHQIS